MKISAMAVCVIFLALVGKTLVYAKHGKILIILKKQKIFIQQNVELSKY